MKTLMLLILLFLTHNTLPMNVSKPVLSPNYNIQKIKGQIITWENDNKHFIYVKGMTYLLENVYRKQKIMKRSKSCPLLLEKKYKIDVLNCSNSNKPVNSGKPKKKHYFNVNPFRNWVYFGIGFSVATFMYRFCFR